MIIDAMEILSEGVVNALCIVSSDSDYTRLATRAREKGFFVIGIGENKTPRAFVNACEAFIYTENLRGSESAETAGETAMDTRRSSGDAGQMVTLLTQAIDATLQESGWAFLGAVGSYLKQLDPGFDPRTYGESQLSGLVRGYPKSFELREQRTASGATLVYVRRRIA